MTLYLLPGHEFSGELVAYEQGGVGWKGSDDGDVDAWMPIDRSSPSGQPTGQHGSVD